MGPRIWKARGTTTFDERFIDAVNRTNKDLTNLRKKPGLKYTVKLLPGNTTLKDGDRVEFIKQERKEDRRKKQDGIKRRHNGNVKFCGTFVCKYSDCIQLVINTIDEEQKSNYFSCRWRDLTSFSWAPATDGDEQAAYAASLPIDSNAVSNAAGTLNRPTP